MYEIITLPAKIKMAPCPEEIDVFTIPHSRMKTLVQKYLNMLTDTNFSDVRHLTTLLENLCNTFQEFRNHEQIENQFIMKKLKEKLKRLSIKNHAVCNCHSDNRLTDMLDLLHDGFKCTEKTAADRINYGIKLRQALEDFTDQFIPHMEEEEEVFQPMLMQYFSFEELCEIKTNVIQRHLLTDEIKTKDKEEVSEKEPTCEILEKDEWEEQEKKTQEKIDCLPDEIMMNILSYLNPKDLCQCAQVSHHWNELATDGSLWKTLLPVQWARGQWSFECEVDKDVEEEKVNVSEQLTMNDRELINEDVDEDADKDESSSDDDQSGDDCDETKQIKKEAKMLTNLVRYLLPRVGMQVKTVNLAYSKGLVNGVLYKILSQCPNLENLDLTQTRISDMAFKGFGRKGCGRRLKTVELSGCVRITDVTLQRLSSALGYLPIIEKSSTERKMEKKEDELNEKAIQCNTECSKCFQSDQEMEKLIKDKEREFQNRDKNEVISCQFEEVLMSPVGGHVGDDRLKNYTFGTEHLNNKFDYCTNGTTTKTFKQECGRSFDNTSNGRVDMHSFLETSNVITKGMHVPVKVNICSDKKYADLNFLHKPLFDKEKLTSASGRNLTHSACESSKLKLSCDAELVKENYLALVSKEVKKTNCNDVVTSLQDKTLTYYESKKPKRTNGSSEPDLQCANTTTNCDNTEDVSNFDVVCRGLEYLSLSGCYHITDTGLRHLTAGGGLPKLRYLDLSGCLNITVDGLTELVSVCPKLEFTDLYYCDNVLDGPYADVASGCQNLECNSRVCCRTGY